MAKLQIITGENNPILRTKSVKVSKFDGELKKFVKDLKKIMVEKDGLGLAAPQVSKNIRVICITLNYGTPNATVIPMINPEILKLSEETEVREEGCLSLPGIFGKVERAKKITVEFLSDDGDKMILNLETLNARVVLHEVDHLNGVLFIDKVTEKAGVESKKM